MFGGNNRSAGRGVFEHCRDARKTAWAKYVELVQPVAVAMSGLGRLDQEVLLLCVWQELDHVSAAVALRVPVGTVKSRLSRARARLRQATDDGPGFPLPSLPRGTSSPGIGHQGTVEESS